jgi:hypothetical protein
MLHAQKCKNKHDRGLATQQLLTCDISVLLQHYDFFNETDNANIANGGQRVATVLLYLSDVQEGRFSRGFLIHIAQQLVYVQALHSFRNVACFGMESVTAAAAGPTYDTNISICMFGRRLLFACTASTRQTAAF